MREFALRLIDAMLALDLAALTSMLAAEVVWHVPPFAQRPPIHGRDGVLRFMQDSQSAYYQAGTLRFAPDIVIAEEANAAAVLGTLTARTIHGGAYENRYSFFFRLAGGGVVEAWELLDTAHLRRQMR
ncbi:MAG: nuclear transport factor 2 family protein [Candidatus Binatia bacterium]